MNTLHFHFIGICGTAMGAVASAIARMGHTVSGSDTNVYPPMSSFLESEGINITKGYAALNIPATANYIVVGNAISRGNLELEAVLERKLRYLSLPETIKEFFLIGKRNFVVTGTHGKTTTTSLLTWIFEYAAKNPSFMIGGIAKNLNRGGRFTDSPFCILEGDEYDTAFFDKRSKFLHYLPELVIINNIEFDHADIYNSIDEIKLSFSRLLKVVPRNGLAIINGDDPHCLDIIDSKTPCPVTTLGLGEQCQIRIEDIVYTPEESAFTLGKKQFSLKMIGEFNVRNAAMAITAARYAGIGDTIIEEALHHFEGVARRQEVRGEANGITIIDDFAHHPTAIKGAIAGLRQRYPNQKIWVLFEPRSNTTRRKVFQKSLAESLSSADVAIIATVDNPTKVQKNDRLCVDTLVNDIAQQGCLSYLGKNTEDIINFVSSKAKPSDIIAVMSNGGFDGIHQKIITRLQSPS